MPSPADHPERLRGAGVGDTAIRDLAQIAFAFSLINRVADALEFKVPGPSPSDGLAT